MNGPLITILNNGSSTPIENTNMTLSCDIAENQLYGNTVTYEWTKDGSNNVLGNQNRLVIIAIKRRDSGSYKCTVKVAAFSFNKEATQNLAVYCK